MSHAALLLAALVLDALFGEPRWLWSRLPHPAVLMGRAVGYADARFNAGPHRRLKGALAFAALGAASLALGAGLAALPGGAVIETLLAAILLSQNSLAAHVRDVGRALRLSLGDGRRAVAKIVGRDTAGMDASAVARGAIESAAENLSDGVVAPAFWFLIGGLPGLLLYKMTNTADSMVGYLTPRHREFGWAAARFDDLLNWLPARLTAVLIAAAHARPGAWPVIRRDARLHRSPNAGWPEAAMAVVLGVALSGPRSYGGARHDFPFVHPEGRRALSPDDIDATVGALWRSWWALFGIVALFAVA